MQLGQSEDFFIEYIIEIIYLNLQIRFHELSLSLSLYVVLQARSICLNLYQFICSDAREAFAKISLSLYVVMPG